MNICALSESECIATVTPTLLEWPGHYLVSAKASNEQDLTIRENSSPLLTTLLAMIKNA